MKLKYVDDLSGGRKRFRRRFPKAVAGVLGEEFFQVPMKARVGAALATEQEALLAEYEKIVTKAKRKAAGQGLLSPLEHWREAVLEAEQLVAQVKGSLSDADKRDVLADDLHRRGADPVLIAAILDPENKHEDRDEPSVTMLDAKRMYEQERLGDNPARNQRNRLERVCRRVEATLGPLGKLPLVDLPLEAFFWHALEQYRWLDRLGMKTVVQPGQSTVHASSSDGMGMTTGSTASNITGSFRWCWDDVRGGGRDRRRRTSSLKVHVKERLMFT